MIYMYFITKKLKEILFLKVNFYGEMVKGSEHINWTLSNHVTDNCLHKFPIFFLKFKDLHNILASTSDRDGQALPWAPFSQHILHIKKKKSCYSIVWSLCLILFQLVGRLYLSRFQPKRKKEKKGVIIGTSTIIKISSFLTCPFTKSNCEKILNTFWIVLMF